jgi:glycosyltransferase involved in cell wall biosynthesis
MTPVHHITVCVCTYRRPELLKLLLLRLADQENGGLFDHSVVVVDNDVLKSAKSVVEKIATSAQIPIAYHVEPRRNIALARNKALESVEGDFVAFIDDDELPVPDWLLRLLKTCLQTGVDGVLGPVVPRYEVEPPIWVTKSRLYDRPRHQTGVLIDRSEGRTGNLLFRRSLLHGEVAVFRPQFGSGGEDRDLFARWMNAGRRFAWCDEAVAYEAVPAVRWKSSFLIRRALLRGQMSLGQAQGRMMKVMRSCVAVPLYIFALPFLWCAGRHVFMKYAISLFDHLGRLLACLRLRPIKETYVTE